MCTIFAFSYSLIIFICNFQVIYDLDELIAKEEEEETAKDTKKDAIKA